MNNIFDHSQVHRTFRNIFTRIGNGYGLTGLNEAYTIEVHWKRKDSYYSILKFVYKRPEKKPYENSGGNTYTRALLASLEPPTQGDWTKDQDGYERLIQEFSFPAWKDMPQ